MVLFLTGKSTESTSRLPPIVYSILQKNNSNNNTDSVLISAISVTDMDRLDKSDAKFVDIIHTAGTKVTRIIEIENEPMPMSMPIPMSIFMIHLIISSNFSNFFGTYCI